MDSTKLFNKCANLLNKLRTGDSDVVLSLNDLFENLFLLLHKYKVKFDLDSFFKVANNPLEPLNFTSNESSSKGRPDSNSNYKKYTKKLLNYTLLYLLELLQHQTHFENALDQLAELLEYEFDGTASLESADDPFHNTPKSLKNGSSNAKNLGNGPKNLDFMHLFLCALFYGSFYHLGIVQHFLLNSRHSVHLPHSLNNLIKNPQKTVPFKRLLNKDVKFGSNQLDTHSNDGKDDNFDHNLNKQFKGSLDETFIERFLIFVTKLNTPDGYRNNSEKGQVLKISKKELAMPNLIKSSSFQPNDGASDDNSAVSDGSEDYDSSNEDGSDSEDNDDSDQERYGNDYIKLWEAILDDLLYKVATRNLVIILESLPTRVLPYIYNPLKIANFLHANCSVGPRNSEVDVVINSLNCIFELILYYNLTDQIVSTFASNEAATATRTDTATDSDTAMNGANTLKNNEFDWFYHRLDALIAFEYLSSYSAVVLISLIERALNSSMLPNKLVSYFVKRLVATASLLDSAGCNCLLVIALGLLQRHHQTLLHQLSAPADSSMVNRNPGPEATNDANTKDSSKHDSGDDSLFLHELYLLLHHFNGDTLKIVGVFFTHLKNKIGFSLGDFLHPQNPLKQLEKSKNSPQSPFRATVHNSTTISRSFFK